MLVNFSIHANYALSNIKSEINFCDIFLALTDCRISPKKDFLILSFFESE